VRLPRRDRDWFVVRRCSTAAGAARREARGDHRLHRIVVLLVVMNWFVHKVYWSEWIGRHHRQRRKVLERTGLARGRRAVSLGFTSVYARASRSSFSRTRLREGSGVVLEGC